jgi:positive regulator of sigma E activity
LFLFILPPNYNKGGEENYLPAAPGIFHTETLINVVPDLLRHKYHNIVKVVAKSPSLVYTTSETAHPTQGIIMNHTDNQCRVVSRNGRVIAVNGNTADIQIIQTSACASCHIKGICTAGEQSAKTVHVSHNGGLQKDMAVRLDMEERFGWLGILFAFVLPLVVVVTALFALPGVTGSEELAALAGMALLLPYYGLLYLSRDYFRKIIRFDAIPITALHKEGVQ